MAKIEKTVFEYFKSDEMFFVGKHREMVDKLWTQNRIQESYFKRLVDLYAVAAIIGLRAKRKSPEDIDGTSDIKRTVQLKQISDNYYILMPIMRLVLIMDDSDGLTAEKKLERAFTIPEDEETYNKNMELFNSYARGGIEYIYEQLILRTPDIDEDFVDAKISNMVALITKSFDEDTI